MVKESKTSGMLLSRLKSFMDRHIYPNELAYRKTLESAQNRFKSSALIDELKKLAVKEGLWNLFIPVDYGHYSENGGITNLEYASLAEEMGRVLWSPEVFNCNAPDTGNMEVLMKYGTPAQQKNWLDPLLKGVIRSSYAMTEPDVASSDATNIQLRIDQDGDEWVLNGRKWFITGAMHENNELLIVMGKTDPDNPDRHRQQSQILVPRDKPGITLVRPLTTLGYDDAPFGHAEILFENVRVPLENILLGPGRGFEIAQGRLGPGRIHHCMRLIGSAQRALELACKRVTNRKVFGKLLSENQSVREDISNSFSDIEMARLLVHETCRKMDKHGTRQARDLIAASKTRVPILVQEVLDRCMQMHGAGGLTTDYFMAEAFNYARWCRQADGPDQIHHMTLGKQIISRHA
ncbi:MAG: acyl-CoA dehydrogenase family protein [Gammaproteobacteria bacterium]|nr:acyl-CoA dehydrogenase family protein [Gammaproteobacteria bacterium]